jgi:hypothetical protein
MPAQMGFTNGILCTEGIRFLIHGLADDNIPFQQSERIRAHDPADIVLWEVPLAGHCGAVNAAAHEFNTRVLGWFTSHDGGYAAIDLLLESA